MRQFNLVNPQMLFSAVIPLFLKTVTCSHRIFLLMCWAYVEATYQVLG